MAQPERHLPAAPVIRPVLAPQAGRVAAIATRAVGVAVIGLGGGRTRPEDRIDHAVGITDLAPINAEVGPDRPLAVVHARSEAEAERAAADIVAAYRIGPEAVAEREVILGRIG